VTDCFGVTIRPIGLDIEKVYIDVLDEKSIKDAVDVSELVVPNARDAYLSGPLSLSFCCTYCIPSMSSARYFKGRPHW